MSDENDRRIYEKLGRHDERLSSLEAWRQQMDGRSTRIIVVVVGAVLTLLITVVAAILLAGLGIGAGP